VDSSPNQHSDRRSEREALYRALIEIAAEEGYGSATPSRVAQAAGLPEAAFHEHFASTKDCFLMLYRNTLLRLMAALQNSIEASGSARWERKVGAGLGTALAFLARDPALTRACLLEARAVGPEATERGEATLRYVIACVTRLRSAEGGPLLGAELMVRGTHAVVRAQDVDLAGRRARRLTRHRRRGAAATPTIPACTRVRTPHSTRSRHSSRAGATGSRGASSRETSESGFSRR
jgi:AcrR family transcriptional regulator